METRQAATQPAIAALLARASSAHGVYETRELGGVYDQHWPAWYAAYLVDHGINDLLGAPLTAEQLAQLLKGYDEEYRRAKPGEGWPAFYARRLATSPSTDS